MSLHNFNSTNKSWTMYTHTLSSISGDHLTVKPNDGKNVILEVSENNSVLIKKGTNVYDLSSLITGQSGSISEGIDASFANIDISENLNPLVVNNSSLGLSTKNWNNAYINNIYGENINTTHYSQRFGNNLWNIIGQDISNGPPLTNNNNKIAISNDGRVVAMASSSHSDISKGRVYVYELSYNQASYNFTRLGLSSEIIVGVSNNDEFGWDIALSSNGRVVAGSSIVSDASGINCGQVRLFELSNNVWRQKGLNINGPRAGSESGYSISLAGNGNSIAIGAWKDSSNGTNICGAVRVYDFSSSINDWRQKGPTIFGISGSNEGYSTALSLDGQTLACGNPSHNTTTSTITTITNTATGGTITTSGSYRIHSFTTVGTSAFVPASSGSVEVLIVGGGGGGGPALGGGGGGGAVIRIPATNVSANTNYSIVVGDGGASGTNGQNSSAFGAIAAGGGTSGSYDTGIGTAGGSGGGAAANGGGLNQGGGVSNVSTLGSNSGFIYGNNGGNMLVSRTGNPTRAAGGGGAGGPALDTNSNTTGDTGRTGMGSGGVGYSSSILGPTYLWGGGGGGAAWSDQVGGYGGLGGGGGGSGLSGGGLGGGSALVDGSNGLVGGNTVGGNGGTNTGGGGGGGTWSVGQGGKGGSGIVIIRYLQQGTINTTIVNLNVGLVKIFSWSGTTWAPKGTIQGPTIQGLDISNSYFGRAINLSANGNAIIIGAVTTLSKVFELNVSNLTIEQHTTNALNNGRTIASILNAEENEQVRQLLASVGRSWAFIGAKRRPNSTAGGKTSADWQWLNGDIWSYTNFYTGEPNNVSEINLHFVTGQNGWNDTGALTDAAIYRQDLRNAQAYVYSFVGDTSWNQLGTTLQTRIQGSNDIGLYVSMSNDGSIISVGTNDISSNRRSYVNVYKYVNNNWIQLGQTISGSVINSSLAFNHALSGDGTTLFHNIGTQSSRVYGMDKWLTLNSNILMISGDLFTSGNLNPLISATRGMSQGTGGTVIISGAYVIHRFDISGTFIPASNGTVEVLLVGGGGGGGPTFGGGGGGGGVVYITSTFVRSGVSYPVVVGSGGTSGTKGQNTTVFGATAAGGGTNSSYDSNGNSGGSGGGAGASQYRINFGGESNGNIIGSNNGIANVGFIYGNRGGNTISIRTGSPFRAAGGGGAGYPGLDTDTNSIGNSGQFGHGSGGIGIINSILGPSYYWGGGGGGSAWTDQSGGWGGYGGGGGGSGSAGGGIGNTLALNSGANGTTTIGGAGGTNTGGGGGGGGGAGGIGGSGIVVIRYLGSVNGSSLGLATKTWGNAYLRDISLNFIEVSGNILFSRAMTSNLGSVLNRWDTLFADDLSINNINGQVYRERTSTLSVSGGLIPINNNILKLGDVSRNWANAYIRDLSVGSIDLSFNLNPLKANGSSLGLITKMWGNAYLRDLSVSSIDVSLSLTPLISNGSRLGLITKIWGNAYLRDLSVSSIDVSQNLNPLLANGSSLGVITKMWGNAYIRDLSVSSIDVSLNLNPLLANGSSLGVITKMWGNAYIRDMSVSSIDVSLNINPLLNNGSSLGLLTRMWRNAYIRDISVSSIDVSTNLITPLLNNTSNLGLPTRIWSNAYIRDISVTSLDVSLNIIPLITNNSNLGSSLNRWKTLFTGDLSVNTINGQVYTSGGGGTSINLSSISGNIIPSVTNTHNLGDVSRNWNNAYIRNLRVSNRVYQEISGDISWSAVNGHYGLSKDAYPSLNPLSSGARAVQTWTGRSVEGVNYWRGVCWSPELRLFVAVANGDNNRVMTSNNGINWSVIVRIEDNAWFGVCWSPQLRLFVAIAYSGTNRVMTSPNGIVWTLQTVPEANQWFGICWSPELGLYVAVAGDGINRVMTSSNGTNWIQRTAAENNYWLSVCWSPQLRLFVAVAGSGTNRVMISSNGINWTSALAAQNNQWYSVCWSPQLGIFVAVALDGVNRVMTSSNGINWTARLAGEANNWYSVCWCAEIMQFVAVAYTGTNRVMTSSNGIDWKPQLAAAVSNWLSVCWSPELGIAVAVADAGGIRVMTSSLKGRPPTSYNVFDSSFNSIDETGKWTFVNVATTTLTVNGANVTSDDRLKHNEVVINNGLDIIDQLCPKFYQKTLDMLDASYNGDLSGQAWNYEAGLIAQEVLQVPDLSYVVSGGDIYDLSNNLIQKEKYGLAYNNIFVYGIAAIKELHAKVKIHETGVLDEQLNSLVTRLEALEQNIS